MANVGDVNVPPTEKDKGRFEAVFLTETIANDPTIDINPIEVKEEPIDEDDQFIENLEDYSVKVEDIQIHVPKIEEETPPSQQIETVYVREQHYRKSIFCNECNVYYEDFCPSCPMMIRVLDNFIEKGILDRAKKTLPTNVLEFSIFDYGDVVATRFIPCGVTFGPFEGVKCTILQNGKCGFDIKDGKIVCKESDSNSNWMRFVQFHPTFESSNLIMIQYAKQLYYRTRVAIKRNEPLLVQFNSSNLHDSYYEPILVGNFATTYDCKPCCFGFSSEAYLRSHLAICSHPRPMPTQIGPSLQGKPSRPPLQNVPPLPSLRPLTTKSITDRLKSIVSQAKPEKQPAKPGECTVCHKMFPNNKELDEHTRLHKKRRRPNKQRCEKCRRFYDANEFDKHMQIHVKKSKPPKPPTLYKCSYCDLMAEKRCVDFVQHMLHKYENSNK
ncbi:hypothetical protein AMK59_4834 [Oryctes borbonicus]|uniref:C2H2-type domain-containing protein n=1 Tax=Oryctes borbonicus TaxID=1629725 RepID=A0A0T6B595_9SCAR|nr:hypothetical protein AMK59_4834 [Oryctes borbonicus]